MNLLIKTFCALLIANFSHAAVNYKFQSEVGSVEFKTKGWPNLVTIKGKGQGVKGEINEDNGMASGTLVFDLNSLKTGIQLRDDHMKNKYLEVGTHPTASLSLASVKLPSNNQGDFKFTGKLKLHGEERSVTGEAELSKDGDKLKMTAEIPIKLSDFKIAIPSYQGITVAEKVTIKFNTQISAITK